jgi:SAM-dependent MidA family methyltransferase
MPRNILPEPPAELKQLSKELSTRLRAEIMANGPIPFARYMDRLLYEPGLGYYSAGLHKLGASGDFVTAPELGSLFAGCLARQVTALASALGDYDVLEIGAGSGRLAVDLMLALPPGHSPARYLILETSADLRRVQRERIEAEAPGWLDRVSWLDRPPQEGWTGLLLANEVIDALPAERFRATSGRAEQLCVTADNDAFDWTGRPAPAQLDAAIRRVEREIGRPLPAGYCSEIRPLLPAWLEAMTGQLQKGLALFIDYGYPRREYYLPERKDGTLMCHYRHRAHDDVFFWPGLQDITAWVDFTALAEAGEDCGLELAGYASQAMFLLGCGLDEVLAGRLADCEDGGLALNAEARQLTLPGMMGERFQVMGLARDLPPQALPLAGFSLQDLSFRL